MSVITGLKNIDIQKYAVVTILDALDIDVDPVDGHLVYAEDPAIPIELNGKILRVDIGKMDRRVQYSVFNPLSREDHAQFLMTLAIYSQVLNELMEADEAKATDFIIHTDTAFTKLPDGSIDPIPKTIAKLELGNDKDKIAGEGLHQEASVAIAMAVLDYAHDAGLVTGDSFLKCLEVINLAYEDAVKMQDLKTTQKRNEMKERKRLLTPQAEEDDRYFEDDDFVQTDLEDADEEYIQNDETWNEPPVNYQDFLRQQEFDSGVIEADTDWMDQDFSDDDFDGLFGENVVRPEQESMFADDGMYSDPVFTQPPEHVVNESFAPPPADFYNTQPNSMFGQNPVPFVPMMPSNESQLPGLKIEDVVSEKDLKKIQERESKGIDMDEWISGERINQNCVDMGYGFGGSVFIPS